MLDAAYVREHLSAVEARLRTRGLDPSAELGQFQALEVERRRLIPVVETLQRDQNAAGEAIARAKREGRDAGEIFAANKARAAEIKQYEAQLAALESLLKA